MEIITPKPATESKTFMAAGKAKWFSVGVSILSAVSGATFLGAPLLNQFMPVEAAQRIQAVSALATTVLGAIAASSSQAAQVGRLGAKAAVYTPQGVKGLNRELAPINYVASSNTERDRMAEVLPYIHGQKSLEQLAEHSRWQEYRS